MHEGGFFFQAFVYLAAAVISVPIAKRLGLGSVLGYLLAGIFIGPFGFHFVGQEGQDVMHFAEFGVVMMLFLIGLELQPKLLWKLRFPILGLGGFQVLLTSSIILVVSIVVGLSWQTGLVVGMILSLSSTAIVLQTLNEKGLMKTDGGQNSFSVLLFQDIAVIPMLAVIPLLAIESVNSLTTSENSHADSWVSNLSVIEQTGVILLAIAGIILVGIYLIRPIFRIIAKTGLREIFTAAALLLVIGIAILMTNVGLSPALGTFLAGVVLAGSEYRHELESDIDPFKGLLLGLFFIAVGASIDFNLIAANPLFILGLVICLIVIKFLVLFILGKFYKMGLDNNFLFSFALAQGGEFAFVLFSFSVQNNVLSSEVANPLIAVVALSMAVTPLLMLINEKILQPKIGTKESDQKSADEIDEENSVIIAGFGRFGSVVGRFLRANGITPTVLDIDADNVDLLRRLGLKVFYGDASRHDLLHSAGAEKAKLIIVAVDESQKTIEIVETIKKHFPHLRILARANSWRNAYQLLEMNVEKVYLETFDTSIRLGVDALRALGLRAYQTYRNAKQFRKHDYETLEYLATVHKDKKEFIRSAKQRIQDLEQLILSEAKREDNSRDLGWDTSSLIKEFSKK